MIFPFLTFPCFPCYPVAVRRFILALLISLVPLGHAAQDVWRPFVIGRPPFKIGTGEPVQSRIAQLWMLCREDRMMRRHCLRIIALVDHESAGTWDPAIRGDGGCSVGIAQWNGCVGRRAPKDFEGQARQIIVEMHAKFRLWSMDTATCAHNSPALRCGNYVQKVRTSEGKFR